MYKASRRVKVLPQLKPGNMRHGIGYGLIAQSDYFSVLRPVLWFAFIFGRIPFSVRSGWMRFSYKSFPFAYAFMVLLANWTIHLYYSEQISDAMRKIMGSSVTFNNVLFGFLVILHPISTMVLFYSWIFELPAIVECFNTTAILERNMADFFPAQKRKTSTRRAAMFFIASFIVSDMITGYILVVGRYGGEFPLLFLLSIIVNVVVTYSYSFLWCVSFYFISHSAAKLNKYILLVNDDKSSVLKACKRIWLSLWIQSQNFSKSNATTVGFALFINGVIYVVGCYGAVASLRNEDLIGFLGITPYIFVSFFAITFVLEMSYRATNALGNAFLDTLVVLNKEARDQKTVDEIHKFMDTIKQTRNASITLNDFVTMDRTLLISFLSYSLTYLIVLLQFQDQDPGGICLSQNYTKLSVGIRNRSNPIGLQL